MRRMLKDGRRHLTDLCGMLDVEWRQNWKEIGTGHCLGDVDVDEQVVVGKQAGSHPVSGHHHFNHHHRLFVGPVRARHSAFLIDKMQLKSKISDPPKYLTSKLRFQILHRISSLK